MEVTELKEYHCAFRGRIEPPPGSAFGWAYLSDPDDAAESIEFILEAWSLQGQPFFRRFEHYPANFHALVTGRAPSSVQGREALTYGRIALHLGLRERAQQLAQAGLVEVPEAATLLRQDLETLLAQCASA